MACYKSPPNSHLSRLMSLLSLFVWMSPPLPTALIETIVSQDFLSGADLLLLCHFSYSWTRGNGKISVFPVPSAWLVCGLLLHLFFKFLMYVECGVKLFRPAQAAKSLKIAPQTARGLFIYLRKSITHTCSYHRFAVILVKDSSISYLNRKSLSLMRRLNNTAELNST